MGYKYETVTHVGPHCCLLSQTLKQTICLLTVVWPAQYHSWRTNKKNTPKTNNAHSGSKDRVILFLISGSMMGDFVRVGGGWCLVTRSCLHTTGPALTAYQISPIATFYWGCNVSQCSLGLRSAGIVNTNPIIFFIGHESAPVVVLCSCWSHDEENLSAFQEAESFVKVFWFYSRVCQSKLIVMQKNCSQSAFSI